MEANTILYGQSTPEFESDHKGLMLEYKYALSDQWSFIAGARQDEETLSQKLNSSRLAVIYSPTDRWVHKLMKAHSIRNPVADELYQVKLQRGGADKSESLDSVEYIVNYQHSDALHFDVSTYWYELDAVSFDGKNGFINKTGLQELVGLEFEVASQSNRLDWYLSYAFNNLVNFTTDDEILNQGLTAAPTGFGTDLANWYKHSVKLRGSYVVNSA